MYRFGIHKTCSNKTFPHVMFLSRAGVWRLFASLLYSIAYQIDEERYYPYVTTYIDEMTIFCEVLKLVLLHCIAKILK